MSDYILVHGSWHGSWVWARVAALLEDAGHSVSAPDLPGRGRDGRDPSATTLAGHVDTVLRALESRDGSAILVGHSFGGFVISHAAEAAPHLIRLLVYVGAFLLRRGETVLGVATSIPHPIPHLLISEEEGLVWVDREVAADVFYDDCHPRVAADAVARLVPEAIAPRRTPAELTDDRYGRVPRVYIETVNDRALPVALQRRMYAALPCRKVVPIASGHSPFLSMPERLADRLLELDDAEKEGTSMQGRTMP